MSPDPLIRQGCAIATVETGAQQQSQGPDGLMFRWRKVIERIPPNFQCRITDFLRNNRRSA